MAPEHVDASSGEGHERPGRAASLGSLAGVVGLRGWAAWMLIMAEV
jgi:hypothetical protein